MEEPGDVDARFFFWNIYVLGMKKQSRNSVSGWDDKKYQKIT